jgi:FeS assembly SUF system protein
MSIEDDDVTKHERTHLPVLPHSGKVEQLRQEAAMSEKPAEPRPPAPASPPAPATAATKTIEQKLLEGKVIAAVSTIFDPEIPVNIYELGLIYKIDIGDDRTVKVDMSLTSPNCPSAQELPIMVENAISSVPGVKETKVEVVWDPTWDPSRMSDEARLVLNMW